MNTKAQKSSGFNSDQELAKFLLSNLASSLKEAVKVTVRIMFKQEMEDFRQKINEQLSFNGYYQRNMTSPLGQIDNIDVPRFREKQQREMNLQTSGVFSKALGQDLKVIYRAQTKKKAQSLADKFAKKWFVAEEAAVRSLRFDFEKTLTYFAYPEDTWKKIRTTNILEREFREVKRRIKVFDNSFNHQPSMENYANTIFNNLNNHYPALHTKV